MLNIINVKKIIVIILDKSNKETSRWDEAKDWEWVCIPTPIRAQ